MEKNVWILMIHLWDIWSWLLLMHTWGGSRCMSWMSLLLQTQLRGILAMLCLLVIFSKSNVLFHQWRVQIVHKLQWNPAYIPSFISPILKWLSWMYCSHIQRSNKANESRWKKGNSTLKLITSCSFVQNYSALSNY